MTKESLMEAAKQGDFYGLISKKDLKDIMPSPAGLHAVVRASAGELFLISKE